MKKPKKRKVHPVRPLTEYQTPDGFKFVNQERDSLDAFRARMQQYKAAAQVKPMANVATLRRKSA